MWGFVILTCNESESFLIGLYLTVATMIGLELINRLKLLTISKVMTGQLTSSDYNSTFKQITSIMQKSSEL